MTEKKDLLHQELLNKFDGDLPEHLSQLFEELDESELELFLEDSQVPFKENHHHKEYMRGLKNNEYYVKLLEAYRQGDETLTVKQVETAKLVDKILKKTEKHPDYYVEREGEMSKLPQEKQIAINQKIRRETHEKLNNYKGLTADEAIELAIEEDGTLPKPSNTLD